MNRDDSLTCYVLSRKALPLARTLAQSLAGIPLADSQRLGDARVREICAPARFVADRMCVPFQRLGDFLAQRYRRHAAHVFMGAVGIAVRALAPLLTHKSGDPL
ncbi:MAG: hypothetical protein LBV65_00575 [Desulfovibrio sp.]|nr:hypothetical protein [Desulfovibrio sp.]